MDEVYSLSRHFYQDLSSTCLAGAASHCLDPSTCRVLTDLDAPALTVATLGTKKIAIQDSIKVQTSFIVNSIEAKTMMKAKRGKPIVRNLSGPVAVPFSPAFDKRPTAQACPP